MYHTNLVRAILYAKLGVPITFSIRKIFMDKYVLKKL